jgi:hypothetical protein
MDSPFLVRTPCRALFFHAPQRRILNAAKPRLCAGALRKAHRKEPSATPGPRSPGPVSIPGLRLYWLAWRPLSFSPSPFLRLTCAVKRPNWADQKKSSAWNKIPYATFCSQVGRSGSRTHLPAFHTPSTALRPLPPLAPPGNVYAQLALPPRFQFWQEWLQMDLKNPFRAASRAAARAPRATRLPDIEKHRSKCGVCSHPQLRDIEDDYLEYVSCREIARRYGFHSHHTVSDHAQAMGLVYRRVRNVTLALDSVIEHVRELTPTVSNVLTAIRMIVDINSQGEWFAPGEKVFTKALFNRMTREECNTYAVKGELPDWFRKAIGQTPERRAAASGGENESHSTPESGHGDHAP